MYFSCSQFLVSLLYACIFQVSPALREIIEKWESVSITTDIWTSSSLDPYISITAHGISLDTFQLHNLVLAMTPFSGSHTAEAIRAQFKTVMQVFTILSLSFPVTIMHFFTELGSR